VRALTNRSSGKMGFAVAAEAARRGARTILVAAPSSLATPAGVERRDVGSALEMRAAVLEAFEGADVAVMAAAVADFRPRQPAAVKMKKADGVPSIEFESTEDILAGLGASHRADQVIVGFAAETNDVREHARAKLDAKNIDLIVANNVAAPGVGFEHDTNQVRIMSRSGSEREVALQDKHAVARAVLDEVVAYRSAR
jgi:phosphopantothenoylcysteine decarboxylase/phosphopantothenate--cysteine ligase